MLVNESSRLALWVYSFWDARVCISFNCEKNHIAIATQNQHFITATTLLYENETTLSHSKCLLGSLNPTTNNIFQLQPQWGWTKNPRFQGGEPEME